MAKRKNSENQTEDEGLEIEETSPSPEASDVNDAPDTVSQSDEGLEVTGDETDADDDDAESVEDVVEASGEAVEATEDGTPDDENVTVGDESDDIQGGVEETREDSAEPSDSSEQSTPVVEKLVEQRVIERKGGFVPMALGGVVAAALGYGVAAYSGGQWPFAADTTNPFETETRATLAEHSEGISTVETTLAELSARVEGIDLEPLESGVASATDAISALLSNHATISESLEALTARIDTIEKQPLEQAVSPEAIAAYERALDDLRAEIDAQREEVASMAEEAVRVEQSAENNARLSAARAALADLTSALDSGDGFQDAIAALTDAGVAVPETLSGVATDGVVTQSALIDAFPDAARAALAAARHEATDAEEGSARVATFLRNQLGARSVTPREGDDPDAVLSRAEAAVKNSDLATALEEIANLPESAQAALGDWPALARTRLEAKSAADALAQQLIQE